MSQHRPPRLPKTVLKELEGLPWRWERGSRHWRLLIDGRQVLVCSSDFNSRRDIRSTQNAVGHIRRYRRSLSVSPGRDRHDASPMASM